ncbi:hypothetical protein SAMN05216486_10417 [bacterium JGI 053]|nr:hypothetical protein SAMN05216486_10417 [bacterium JGI 053]
MSRKPWRTIIGGDATGRFTRSQIEAAVKAVKARNDGSRKPASAAPSVASIHPGPPVPDLESEYARMAADGDREAEAREWADALLPDVSDEPEMSP